MTWNRDLIQQPKEPIGYFNGSLVPIREISVPALDLGFIHGVTVAEQVRTFHGKPFLLDEHFTRWQRGLELVGIDLPCELDQLNELIAQLINYNASLLSAKAEQGICFFCTPAGSKDPWSEFINSEGIQPSLSQSKFGIYTYPIAASDNQRRYRDGVALRTTPFADVPSDCWPRGIKVRSRLHYYLAQREATRQAMPDSTAYPILLDLNGNVSDSSIGSIAAWSEKDGLIVRPQEDRYDSITLKFVMELARSLGMPVTERYLPASQLVEVDELLLVSTPWCIYPVNQVDNFRLLASQTGYQTFRRLMQAWETFVSCSICG